MTTSPLDATHPSRHSPSRAPLRWALVAAAVLVIAAVWPVSGNAPSVLSAATADTPVRALPPVIAIAGTRDPSLPDAAEALVGTADDVQDPAPTF